MKKIFVALTITLIFSSYANAAVYKGQKIFIKKCVQCHNLRRAFVSSKTTYEWETLMLDNGKELAYVHLKDEKAKKSWEYFKSSSYTKKTKHLEDFLLEYAKDSGNVPACN
ncbi:MAG: cytochrome C [Sulfurimonas sp.]|uniref:cytochrome C n=1 Tax=Sulfurimonas sp. TaxID=2022749 RepID=UPI0025F40F8D|nr:cytochrome C [Sulfurimonas sp.]MCK9491352.1 cytochrome C [Sulfurimonas sp.]